MAVALERGVSVPTRDAGALTASLYKEHAGELLRFAWHRLGRVEDAEDAVQATFLSAHRVLQEGERVREPRAWLFRILRNECLTRIALVKRRGVHESLEEWHADNGPSVEEDFERRDAFDATVALLGTLPEQQREAMVLREWLGLSAIETSEVLETTPQGVDALVYRARKALVAVPEVEDDSDCAEVRAALADDAITNRTRAHLLRCRSCRAASRRLRAPEEMAVNSGLPLDGIASRLGESIPGFAFGAGTAAVAAGGGIAAAASSIAGASVAAKVVIGVTATAVVAGGTLGTVPVVRDAVRPPAKVQTERITSHSASLGTASSGEVAIVDAVKAKQDVAAAPADSAGVAVSDPAQPTVKPAQPADEGQAQSGGATASAPESAAPVAGADPVAAAPAVGEEEVEAPTPEKAPLSAVKPTPVKKPEEAKKPEGSKQPVSGGVPVEPGKKPEDAKKPEEAKKPEGSKQPTGVVAQPEAPGKKPEDAKKPEGSKQPTGVVAQPEAPAKKPEEPKQAEEPKKPEAAKQPAATVPPAPAKKPEESKKPDEAKRSEAATPAPAAAPVATPAPPKAEKPSEGKPDKKRDGGD